MSASIQTDRFVHDNLPPPEAWPELLFGPPDYDYPARLNCADRLLDHWIETGAGDRPAVRSGRTIVTYAELAAQANRIANLLTDRFAIAPGNRILIRGANTPALAAIWFAVQKAGAVAVTTMPLLRATELEAIIEISQPSLAFCQQGRCDELVAAARQTSLGAILTYRGVLDGADARPDELATLMADQPKTFRTSPTASTDISLIGFTSGTTGRPKATVHFHRDVMAICDGVCRHVIDPRPEDIFIGTPPFGFTFGLGGLLLFPFYGGASTVLAERYDPAGLVASIAEHRATVCFTVPTFYRRMAPIADRQRVASLRLCVASGEPLPLATREAWRAATGIALTEFLGSTELLHAFVAATGADVRPGKIGKAVPGYRLAVLDDQGRVLPPNEVGRLAVKGPTGCRYLADPRQAEYVQDGWNITGDLCAIDADGYVAFHARADDMIVTAGYNVSAVEVEAALLRHPAVADCAVVGRPDPARGQSVTAFVVVADGITADDALIAALQDHVKATIAPYKYPRRITFLDALPRNAAGKVQRFRLR